MFPKLLAGSVVALSIGQAYAAGYAWSGVNMGGFDFGCTTDGTCNIDNIVPPLHQYKGQDGAGQMKHFVEDAGLNTFRLPVAWQYLVNNQVGGDLDATALEKYDALVQACLVTGAFCIIDIHNYARWNGEIIGQGGPKNEEFASLWSQLAKKYAKDVKVVMGMINEPHDIPDLTIWADTVQAAVTAIRRAGATEHTILLPGTGYTSAESFVSSGSAAALAKVTNPDGSTTNLIFDVHKYLDYDNSGTHTQCVGNDISAAFAPLAKWLRGEKRQALLSEIGGGSEAASCLQDVCAVADYLNENSDVYLGVLGWAAGSFDDTYILSLTPTETGGTWTDKPLLTKCFADKFQGGSGATNSSTGPSGGDSGSGGSSAGVSSGPAPGPTSSEIGDAFSTAAAPASSQTQYLGGVLPHLTGPRPTFAGVTPLAIPTFTGGDSSGSGDLGGGLNNLGNNGPLTTTSSSSSSSAAAGTNTPFPAGGSNTWAFQNSSNVPGATGTGGGTAPALPPVTTTMPVNGGAWQPTTMQTVVVSSTTSAPAIVQGGGAVGGEVGGSASKGRLEQGGWDHLGTEGEEEGEGEECDWVED